MKRAAWFWILGAVALAYLYGCGAGSDRPRAGDTVTPVLVRPMHFKPGEVVNVAVLLQATGSDGAQRDLGFAGIYDDPLARVTFLEGDRVLNSYEVRLSHRC